MARGDVPALKPGFATSYELLFCTGDVVGRENMSSTALPCDPVPGFRPARLARMVRDLEKAGFEFLAQHVTIPRSPRTGGQSRRANVANGQISSREEEFDRHSSCDRTFAD
jgi:hypothetical protein